MTNYEEKAKDIRELLLKQSGEKLAASVNEKCGANISSTTITRASNQKDISANTLCLIHYVLTH